MVYLLVGLHLRDAFWQHTLIGPEDVPVITTASSKVYEATFHIFDVLLLISNFELEQVLEDELDDKVLAVT